MQRPPAVLQQTLMPPAVYGPDRGELLPEVPVDAPVPTAAGLQAAIGVALADPAIAGRLAVHLEHVPAELRHLVEEQYPVVGEADLPRPRGLPGE